MFFYETIIDDLDGNIQNIDILTIMNIINARMKYYTKTGNIS